MVTVTNVLLRQNSEGQPFIALELTGPLVLVKAQESGRYYATAKRCSVTSTFSEVEARGLLGTQLPGSIEREACDPYEFTVPETGEVITLSHRWTYRPDGSAPAVEPAPVRPLLPTLHVA